MEKTVEYPNTKFSPEIIMKGLKELQKYIDEKDLKKPGMHFSVWKSKERWDHDNESEFFADYRKDDVYLGRFKYWYSNEALGVSFDSNNISEVSVTSKSRQIIESVFQIFDDAAPLSKYPKLTSTHEIPWESKVNIFIGHGQKDIWRDLKDHLQDKHKFMVNFYEMGTQTGHNIKDILQKMRLQSNFAILVFTGENMDSEGKLHARENVIHELGLFQGALGFNKTIILLEEGVQKFSNIEGFQYISFPKGKIETTYGEILATIRREFSPTRK